MKNRDWVKRQPAAESRQPVSNKRHDDFDARLASYGGDVFYEEIGGDEHRTWAELSPEGKLAYIARDAVRADVPIERFAEAAREIVGGKAADRESVYLRLLLDSERDLMGLSKLLPESGHDLFAPSRPLTEQFREFIGDLINEINSRAPRQQDSQQKDRGGREGR